MTPIDSSLRKEVLEYLEGMYKNFKDKRALELFSRLQPRKRGRKVGWRKPKEIKEESI